MLCVCAPLEETKVRSNQYAVPGVRPVTMPPVAKFELTLVEPDPDALEGAPTCVPVAPTAAPLDGAVPVPYRRVVVAPAPPFAFNVQKTRT